MAKKKPLEVQLKQMRYKFAADLVKAKNVIYKREERKWTKEADRKWKTKEKNMLSKQKKKLDELQREILWKKPLKANKIIPKKDTLSAIKTDAQSIFQLWSRLKLSDGNWHTPIMNKEESRVAYNDKIVGWHYYPKSKYPHIMYYEDNCFAQDSRDNTELGSMVAHHCEFNVRCFIWDKRFKQLQALSEDQVMRNQIRKKDFHIDAIRKYWKKIVDLEEERGEVYMNKKLRKRYVEFKI